MVWRCSSPDLPVAQAILFVFLAFIIVRHYKVVDIAFSNSSVSWKALLLLIAFSCIAVIQFLAAPLFGTVHPVTGAAIGHPNPEGFWITFQSVLFFVAALVVVRVQLEGNPRFERYLFTLLTCIALSVSLIALSHWFYDNESSFGPSSLIMSLTAHVLAGRL